MHEPAIPIDSEMFRGNHENPHGGTRGSGEVMLYLLPIAPYSVWEGKGKA